MTSSLGAGGVCLIVKTDWRRLVLLVVGRVPEDAVPNGIPFEHRVKQVSDVAVFPHEGALEVWQSNATLYHIADKLPHWPVNPGELRLRHLHQLLLHTSLGVSVAMAARRSPHQFERDLAS